MVESAVHSGYPIIAVDAFGDQDLSRLADSYSLHRDSHSPYSAQALYRASRNFDYDAVAYTSNLENHPEILGRLAGDRPIIGNRPSAIVSVRNWKVLFSRLRQAGFSVPDTIFADEGRSIDANHKWLIKPVLSGGGHGIAFLQGGARVGHSVMIQEYIPGKSCSAAFVANGRESRLIGITEQLTGLHHFNSHGFRYCGNILPLPESLPSDDGKRVLYQVSRLTTFLVQEYGLMGVNGIDFILNEGRVVLTEVNPRYSASMELMEQAYNLPVFHLHVQAVLNGTLPDFDLGTHMEPAAFFGKGILYAGIDCVMPDTSGWGFRSIRDIPVPGETVREGSPVCTILTKRSTYEETVSGLIEKAGILKEEIHG